jgi:hypothetical protein
MRDASTLGNVVNANLQLALFVILKEELKDLLSPVCAVGKETEV